MAPKTGYIEAAFLFSIRTYYRYTLRILVPMEYEQFWNVLQGHTPNEVGIIIERMISCNHPTLKPENKNKCMTIFSYILQVSFDFKW